MARIPPYCWLVLPGFALVFLIWVNALRFKRANYLSLLPGRAEMVDELTTQSSTGYANNLRELILSDRNEDSFHWIAQTQQMLAQKEWRIRHVDYDNAPFGRSVNSASPYRWWFGLVAWFDHIISSRPLGLSVERAALWVDPLLQGLLLIGGTLFVAWHFGRWAAAVLGLGVATSFPFGATFIPGVPDSQGLAVVLVMGSLLLLVKGTALLYSDGEMPPRTRGRRWFFGAGVLGGLSLWVTVSIQVPVLIGIGLGALFSALIARQSTDSEALPAWRAWALGGSLTILIAYLAEYSPNDFTGWRLESIHPLYGLAWLGAGELLARLSALIQRRRGKARVKDVIAITFSMGALASIPVVMFRTGSAAFLDRDLTWLRLTHLPESATATSFWTWVIHAGLNATVATVLLPLVIGAIAVWLILTKRYDVSYRAMLGLLLGPVAIATGFAWGQLSWWSVVDGVLLGVVVVMTATNSAGSRRIRGWLGWAPAALLVVPGLIQLWPRPVSSGPPVLSATEAELLIERDLAHWLAKHSQYEPAVIYAPPNESTTLGFYGGMRVIGNYSLDNEEALKATLKIAAAASVQEAKLLLQGREVRYLVLPSWDSFFEDYAHLYEARNSASWNEFFLSTLREWRLPPWLRLLPYETPGIGGLEKQSVFVFEIVADQSPAVAAARLAESWLAIGETERAAQSVTVLRQFPGDIGALAALAQVEFASGNNEGFEQTSTLLLKRLSGGGDRYLPWDRRVSLAVVLARAKHPDLARLQVQQCLTGIDGKKVRSLSTGALYNLLGLSRSFSLEITDPKIRALSLQLLPADMRAHVQ